MTQTKLQSQEYFQEIYETHVDMVYRICFTYLKNTADAEDMVQNTFIKFLECQEPFKSKEHEKAWLIVTAGNLCKNHLKHWWSRRFSLDERDIPGFMEEPQTKELMEALWRLPEKYRIALYLYYIEGYKSSEIAEMTGKSSSAVRTQLERGRDSLRKILGGDFF